MSFPIIVNGSTTVISVRATNFTYDDGTSAVVLLSSINSFGSMITVFDEDGYVGGINNRKIIISTTRNVTFDSGQPLGGGAGDFKYFLTQKNQSLSVFPRTLNQWVLPQSVITSQLANPNSGILINGTDFNALQAQMIAISTNLEVYGSTISGKPFTINSRVLTSYTQDSLVVPGIQALTTSTGAVTVGAIVVDNIGSVNQITQNLKNTNFIQASSFSTFVQTTSSLATHTLVISDDLTGIPSILSLNTSNTIWNGSNLPYGTASTFSAGLLYYSTSLKYLNVNPGLSSISSFIPDSVSSIVGANVLSSYSTNFINLVNSLNYGPGVSSLSTMINAGLSSLVVAPALSTLSTVISRGLSSVYISPGLSSLYNMFNIALSTVATNYGVSSLSTSISLGLSTVNATLAFSNVSTIYSIGVSDIANYTGISSFSTVITPFYSSLILQEGVSSLSTFIFSTVSSLVVGPGLSSLSTTTGNYYSTLNSPAGLSSLSTSMSIFSTHSVSLGLSSLSSFVGPGLSSLSVFGGLSTISTTVAAGLINVKGNEGISTLSTVINSVASSLNTSQGASSLFFFIRNQFSTLSDQGGISSLSSFIGPAFSSIVNAGSGSIQTPANLSTLIINVCTFKMWDSMNYVYRNLNISASKLYIDNTLIDSFVVQSTSRSTISISSYNIDIAAILNTSTLFGTSLYLASDFGASTSVSTVSTGLLTTSSFLTSSISFDNKALYASNSGLYFNGSTLTLFSSIGTSSFSTTMSAVSSLSNILPLPFSNISTALSIGASSMMFGQGVSTLSTLFTQASTVNLFPGISTKNFLASTGFVSTISSFGQLSTFLRVDTLLNVSSLIVSTLIASNANIGVLNLPTSFISSFTFVNNNSSNTISSLSTFVTGGGISAGTVFVNRLSVSTFASSLNANATYASSLLISTLFIPNIGASPNPAPFTVSSGTIWFNGSNLANAGDPNNLTNLMFAFSTASIYTSTLIVSSLQTPTIIKTNTMTVGENIVITQSSLNLYNRTVLSSYIDTLTSEPQTYFDMIQYSTDGINWKATNWLQSSIGAGTAGIIGKPSYNGMYWLVGNAKNTNPNGSGYEMNNYNNSVMYSPDGLNYYALENNQFDLQAIQPKWNGQYWLAGDVLDTTSERTIKRSFDGLIWTPANSGGFYGTCQNFGWNGWLWIAVGNGSGAESFNSNIQYSTDGLNWSNAEGSLPEIQANCVIFDGKKWIVGGQAYTSFVYSYDGSNWTTSPVADSNIVYDIAYNGKIYVAAGSLVEASYGLAYSYDGINWTYANAFLPDSYNSDFPLDGSAYSVTWSGDRFVAVGSNTFVPLSGVYSFDGLTWIPVNDPIPGDPAVDLGQGVGFASNILPALETTTLRIHTMGKGYIPLYLTSTNHWQVTPSSIIMNNNFTINKELGSDKRVGMGTPYPLATLDIAGTMNVNNSSFFSSIVIGSSFGYNGSTQTAGFVPTFDVTIFGSSLMNSLVINTASGVARRGPLDVTSPGQPIINRGAYLNISSFGRSFPITSTLVNINQVATFPQTGTNDPADNSFVYWLWNNGPGQQQSSLFFALSGTPSFFTGQHACYVSSVTQDNVSSFVGLITSSDDQGYVSVTANGEIVSGSNAIYSTESLPRVSLTNADMQKGVFGVISDKQNLPAAVNFSTLNSAYDIQSGFRNALYGRLLVNGVGDGALWTTNVNGNVSIGDYLCSSAVPGHARVQDDPSGMYNYTVAKATMNCDFDLNSSNYRCEPIEFNGSTFVRAFIGVTYHCG